MITNNLPYRLTLEDAVDIWLRHWDGQYQHHIAADYRINPGRVNDVLKGRRFPEAKAMAGAIRRPANDR